MMSKKSRSTVDLETLRSIFSANMIARRLIPTAVESVDLVLQLCDVENVKVNT